MPLYSENFYRYWKNECARQTSPNDYTIKRVYRDADNYVKSYFSHILAFTDFIIDGNELFLKIKDKNKFREFYNNASKTDSDYVLVKSTIEQNKRIYKIILEAKRILPEYESIIDKIAIYTTFSSPLNAGALPTPTGYGILLNDGIVNFPKYAHKALEAVHSTTDNWNNDIENYFNSTVKHCVDNNIPFNKDELRAYWLKLMPSPDKNEVKFKFTDAFLTALEILNLKTPSLNILHNRSELIKRKSYNPQLKFRPLGGESYHADLTTIKVIEPFIFFHELGHILLGHTDVLRDWFNNKPSSIKDIENRILECKKMEYEADQFAIEMLLKINDNLIFLAGGIKQMFELFSFSEINFTALQKHSSSRFFKRIGYKENDDSPKHQLSMHLKTHPPSINRLYHLWDILISKQPKIDFEKVKWWKNASDEEKILEMARTGKSYEYEEYRFPPTKSICDNLTSYINNCCSSMIDTILEEEDTDQIKYSIPVSDYEFKTRYNL